MASRCGGRLRDLTELPRLLEPGRIFKLCAGCLHGQHYEHQNPCDCDDWNDAQRANTALSGMIGRVFTGELSRRATCPQCNGYGEVDA